MNKLQVHKFLVIFITILLCECSHGERRDPDPSSCVQVNLNLEQCKAKIVDQYDEIEQLKQRECPTQRANANTQRCHSTRVFRDNQNKYLKSVCFVREGYSYNDAEGFCLSNGMDLLIFENRAVNDEFLKYMEVSLGLGSNVWNHGYGAWVNGRFNGTNWNAIKNFKDQDIGKGVNFGTEYQNSGNCAAYKRNYGYEIRNYDCRQTYYFYCEYQSHM